MSKKNGPRQRRTRFLKEYLKDHNATQAAIRAGYSKKSAKVTGHRLLTDANVRAEIEKANAAVNEKLDITVERVKLELARLAFYDPRKFFKDDGSIKSISELDDDSAMALAGLDVNELFEGRGEERDLVGYIKKVKLADKLHALEQLGRHLKMFTDKVEVTTGDVLVSKLLAGRQRAAERR